MSGPITNLSFETSTDGTNPDGWTFSFVSSVEELDKFVAGVLEGFESGWGTTLETTIVAGVNGVADQFTNPVGITPIFKEGFEVGWSNNAYTTELLGEPAPFGAADVGGQEGFEGWSVFQEVFGSSVSAGLNDFESGWRNDVYHRTIDLIGVQNRFDGHLRTLVETFEAVALDQPVTVDTSGGGTEGQITFPVPHGFSSVFSCQVYSPNGSLPAGMLPGVKYGIIFVSSTVITLLVGSVPVAPTAQGTGVVYVTEPYEFWTSVLSF